MSEKISILDSNNISRKQFDEKYETKCIRKAFKKYLFGIYGHDPK